MMLPMARMLFFSELFGKVAAVIWWTWQPWSPVGALLFFVPDIFVLYHLFVPSGQWLCQVFTHFEAADDEVWLTIDDGPDREDTPRILDLLDQHRARATFFVVGERVARWPHLITEILRRGHEIGHHTQTHPAGTFWCASRSRVRSEIDDALAVLRALDTKPVRFRPPVGIKNIFLAAALKKRAMSCVGWTIRSGDCLGLRAEDVVEKVMRQVRPGSILLLHEGNSVPRHMRVKAISLLLESLTAQGYRCVVPRLDQLRPQNGRENRAVLNRVSAPEASPVSVAD
jgi:peptidoglycan/xylan/chitin deacetylase (PgdA/CDA1 family)